MTRLVFPDEGSRLAYRITTGKALYGAPGSVAVLYQDAAATVPATDCRAYDGTPTPGGVAIGPSFTLDAFSRLPIFWGPDGLDTLYVMVDSGVVSPVYARTDDRLDTLTTGVTSAAAAAVAAQSTATGAAAAAAAAYVKPGPGIPLSDLATAVQTGTWLSQAGGSLSGPLAMVSSAAGGPDQTDTTSRITIPSYQTNGDNFFGEGIRLDLMRPYAKNMIAWRLPRPQSPDIEFIGASNASFEVDASGWANIGGASIARSTAQHAAGQASGKITWATAGAGSQGASTVITGLTAGHTYTFTAWVYVPAGAPTMKIDVDGTTASGPSTVTDAWQELTVAFAATGASHTLRVITAAAATAGQFGYTDLVYALSAQSALRSIVWIGAHYEAQDGASIHGHWSLEVPDAADALRTRFEIKFVDSTGKIGLDKTLVQTASADLVVDCSNSQVLRLRTGAGADKYIETANDEWGTLPRWRFGSPGSAEGGANAGSDFGIARFNDAGVQQDLPFQVTRSNGKITMGGAAGTSAGVQVNRASLGNAYSANTNLSGATGAIAYNHNALDATSRTIQANISSDSNFRLVVFADGKHEWGAGAATRDTNLYRAGVSSVALLGILATDSIWKLKSSTTAARPTPASVGAGSVYYDTTLSKPVYSDGTTWRDAAGAAA